MIGKQSLSPRFQTGTVEASVALISAFLFVSAVALRLTLVTAVRFVAIAAIPADSRVAFSGNPSIASHSTIATCSSSSASIANLIWRRPIGNIGIFSPTRFLRRRIGIACANSGSSLVSMRLVRWFAARKQQRTDGDCGEGAKSKVFKWLGQRNSKFVVGTFSVSTFFVTVFSPRIVFGELGFPGRPKMPVWSGLSKIIKACPNRKPSARRIASMSATTVS